METAANDGRVKAVHGGDHRRTSIAGVPDKYWVRNRNAHAGVPVVEVGPLRDLTSSDHRESSRIVAQGDANVIPKKLRGRKETWKTWNVLREWDYLQLLPGEREGD